MELADRSDEALAKALEQTLCTEWDQNVIIAHGKHFSVQRMIDGYQDVFQACLREQEYL